MLEVTMIDEGGAASRLAFDAERVRLFTNTKPNIITVLPQGHAQRPRAEFFIEQSYEQAYGSRIQSHYPTIISLQDSNGKIIAAAGARFADMEPLFLEQYLERPIEIELGHTDLGAATRREIVEIGNLTADARGTSIFLFVALADYLSRRHRSVAVATATSKLRRIFKLVGIDPRQLAPARADALPDRGAAWGSYYRTDPIVLAGSITHAYSKLSRLLAPQHQLASTRPPDILYPLRLANPAPVQA